MVDKMYKSDNSDALVITEFHGIHGAHLGDPCYEQILSAHTGVCTTNSMGQSPSWKIISPSASQEIPHIFRKQKVY